MPREWFRSFFDADYLEVLKATWKPAATRAQVSFIRRALGLKPGSRILDVGCGYGRHGAELARQGYHVVGVDLSEQMVRDARRRWSLHGRLKFVRMDMRRLPYREEFDGVISLYTSFGYFTHRQNVQTLRRMVRALRPGGRLLVDAHNLAHHRKRPKQNSWSKLSSDLFVLQEFVVDPRTGAVTSEWWILSPKRARAVRKTLRLRMYDVAGWRRMLRQTGARLSKAYSGFDGRPFRAPGRRRIILVARRS